MDERPVTAVEPGQRPCVGGVYCCRGGGHRVCACLETLFRMNGYGRIRTSKERGRALCIGAGVGGSTEGLTHSLASISFTFTSRDLFYITKQVYYVV